MPPVEVYINPLMATAISVTQAAVSPIVEASIGDSAPRVPVARNRPPSRVPAAASAFPS